ncbi:MAG: ABC transporter substrate-binding protein, partial [Virgibacillus sp.]|nr:ABC transporter substrate-binding protein [Virgibacillus sp.]
MVKRVLMVIVGALLFTFSVSACSKDKEEEIGGSKEAVENLTEEELPIVKEPIELDIFAGKAATTADDWNDVLLLNEYEEMTNVNITWNQVPADGLD